jgi:hypothetical protein
MLRNLKQFVRVLMAPAFSPEALEVDQGQCASAAIELPPVATPLLAAGPVGGRQTSASC